MAVRQSVRGVLLALWSNCRAAQEHLMAIQVKRTCPLCGSALSAARFAEVLKAHQGMERQLASLRKAELRAKEGLMRAREQAKEAAQRAKEKNARQVEGERKRADDRIKKYRISAATLNMKIQDLERRLKMGETAQSEGLLEEHALLHFLKEHFPGDQYDHVGRGGDIVHAIRTDRGVHVGRIIYEVKRVQQWSSAHIVQCDEAKQLRNADVAILVTNRFPANRQHYFIERGVIVISPLALLPVVHTARDGLLNVHSLKLSGDQKKQALEAVYDYLAGGPYTSHIRRIAQHLRDIEDLFRKEIASHKRVWEKRLKHYQGITKGVSEVDARLRTLILPAMGHTEALSGIADAMLPKFTEIE